MTAESFYALLGGCITAGMLLGTVIVLVNSWRA